MRPYDVKSEKDILSMESDNHPQDSDVWSIMNNPNHVTLFPEPDGPRTDWWPMEHDGHEVWKAWNAFAARNDNPAVIEYRDLYTEATVRDLEERLAKAAEALEPFVNVAEHDIGSNETSEDFFAPMERHNRAPRLRVGDLRRARTALSQIRSEK